MSLSFLAIACGCSKPQETGYKLQKVHVNKSEVELMVGDKITVKASVVPAVAVPPAFTWASADPDIADVNNGQITAKKVGKTVITASTQGKSAEVKVTVTAPPTAEGHIIFNINPNKENQSEELLVDGAGSYTADGLLIDKTGKRVMFNRYYALAERKACYEVRPSADAVMKFYASQEAFNSYVNIPEKKIIIKGSPSDLVETVDFLEGDKDYLVEVINEYNRSTLRITDIQSGQSAFVTGVTDGAGGCGQGAVHSGPSYGMHWDHHCFLLDKGSQMLVKRFYVCSMKNDVKLLIYGDSISQPEGYFPASIFNRAWTQQIIARLNGNAMSSGRGGGTINEVLTYIKNELPFIKTKYVMVTIGTNGGNNADNLGQLVDYIKSCGAIPILNNIPCNESSTQIDINNVIAQVREKKGIKGCRFDVATSVNKDGKQVNKSMMFWEDYTGYPAPMTGWQIYHHPNELGGDAMFAQTLIDIPEIYE